MHTQHTPQTYHAALVHNSDGLVARDENLIGAQIAVGAADLHLGDVLLAPVQLLQNFNHVPRLIGVLVMHEEVKGLLFN